MRQTPSGPRATVPYRELARLSAETRMRVEAGEDGFLDEAIARRDALLAAIRTTPVRADEAEDVRAAIGDVLALDQALLAVLEASREQARLELEQIAESRAALRSYRGGAPSGAVYVDRLS